MANKPETIHQQSAAVPFRVKGGNLEVLLVTTRSGKGWTIPKGFIEPGMTPVESACKEAAEEAGVRGIPSGRSLGTYTRPKWGGMCRIAAFPLKVTKVMASWPEMECRRREWVKAPKVVARTSDLELKPILKALKRFAGLRSGT